MWTLCFIFDTVNGIFGSAVFQSTFLPCLLLILIPTWNVYLACPVFHQWFLTFLLSTHNLLSSSYILPTSHILFYIEVHDVKTFFMLHCEANTVNFGGLATLSWFDLQPHWSSTSGLLASCQGRFPVSSSQWPMLEGTRHVQLPHQGIDTETTGTRRMESHENLLYAEGRKPPWENMPWLDFVTLSLRR